MKKKIEKMQEENKTLNEQIIILTKRIVKMEEENVCFQCQKKLTFNDYKQCDDCSIKMIEEAVKDKIKKMQEENNKLLIRLVESLKLGYLMM